MSDHDMAAAEAEPLKGIEGGNAVRVAAAAALFAGQRCGLEAVARLAALTDAAARGGKGEEFPLQQAWLYVRAITLAADARLLRGDGFPDGAGALCRRAAAEAALSAHRAAFRLSRGDAAGAAADAQAAWRHADEAVQLQAAIYFGAPEYRRWRLLHGRRGYRGPGVVAHLRLVEHLL